MSDLPADLLINAADEIRIRQHLALVALGKRPATRAIRVGRLLDVNGRRWHEDQEIVVSGRRVAWVGPAGKYPGVVDERIDRSHLSAAPGFGEVHKHIESSHLTPEWEAALVLPHGCTWTCEASHEFSKSPFGKSLLMDFVRCAVMIQALDVDRAESWADGPDREEDQAVSVGFDG